MRLVSCSIARRCDSSWLAELFDVNTRLLSVLLLELSHGLLVHCWFWRHRYRLLCCRMLPLPVAFLVFCVAAVLPTICSESPRSRVCAAQCVAHDSRVPPLHHGA